MKIHQEGIMFFRQLMGLFVFVTITSCGNAMAGAGSAQGSFEAVIPLEPPLPTTEPQTRLSSPDLDPQFMVLPNGKSLSSIKVSGSSLSLARGSGDSFGESEKKRYQQLKVDSKVDPDHMVRWAIMDLDGHQMIDTSLSANLRIFGASSSKVYVAATLLDLQQGSVSNDQLETMADMLVVSSNSAWTSLQKEIGDGSSDEGRERNYAFTQRMGYAETRGFQGYLGDMHGNELVATEAVEFLYDTYTMQYPGAEYLWKLMYTCRTGASRGRKYLPESIFVGGKTGTYDGPTENPQTGSQYNVKIRNHLIIVNVNGRQYGIAVFANTGQDEDVAVLVGGLLREYAGLAQD
jgi:hypothetical protein